MAVVKKGEHFKEGGYCFECGEPVGDVAVQYAFWGASKNPIESLAAGVVLHPDCAVTVGNRLICDGYPNRDRER